MSRLIKSYYNQPGCRELLESYRKAAYKAILSNKGYTKRTIPVQRLIPVLPLSTPDYVMPLAEQIRSGLATKGESLGSFGNDSFDPPGASPDIISQFGYDRLDRLDYVRDHGLSAKAEAVMESITAASNSTSSDDAEKSSSEESSTTESTTADK